MPGVALPCLGDASVAACDDGLFAGAGGAGSQSDLASLWQKDEGERSGAEGGRRRSYAQALDHLERDAQIRPTLDV